MKQVIYVVFVGTILVANNHVEVMPDKGCLSLLRFVKSRAEAARTPRATAWEDL